MALSGEREPDLAVCRVGAARGNVEAELGPPTTVKSVEGGGTRCTYEYELDNEPSLSRAAMHAGMDVLTIGIWDAVIGTDLEMQKGHKFKLTVTYDREGKVQAIETRRVE
jgi:hypothetical protein